MIAESAASIPVTLGTFQLVIGALVSGILALFGYMYKRAMKCEERHDEQQKELGELKERVGFASAIAEMVNACNTAGCNFKDKVQGYSVSALEKTKRRNQQKPEL